MIKFRNVNKSFGRNTVFEGHFLHRGQGQSGYHNWSQRLGKTTTLKMINRLIKPTSGDIFIGRGEHPRQGRDSAAPGHGLRNPADRPVLPHDRAGKTSEISPKLSGPTPEQTEAPGADGDGGHGPDTYLDRYPPSSPAASSSGLAWPGRFATDPEIILMDEAFSALDPITRTKLPGRVARASERPEQNHRLCHPRHGRAGGSWTGSASGQGNPQYDTLRSSC